jgi:tetrapyrrole methylase family protein/MazG family protein
LATITILGLGPGDAGLLTRQAWELLQHTPLLYLRTAIHPTVAGLPPTTELRSFDARYETAGAFGEVYAQIVSELIERAASGESLVYAVPGHPLVAEATTRHLLAQARARGIATQIVAGVSFIEPVCAALGFDPLEHGLQLLDALDLVPAATDDQPLSVAEQEEKRPSSNGDRRSSASWASLHGHEYTPPLTPFPLLTTRPALLCQVYSRRVASEAKLSLMERYPSDHPVTLVRAAGVADDERVWTVPLHALDHQDDLDHLTCAFLPALAPLDDRRGPEGIGYVVARLLGPGGCPWDREQTHQSLRPELLEETHEVLEALDADDTAALAEELGDVLLSVLMHSEIGRQAGEFDIGDVYEQIATKLIRRHPHVFGDVTVSDSGEVLANWDAIKQAERAADGKAPRGVFDGIPPALPALMAAQETIRKAAKAGFDSDNPQWAWDKLHEELNEVRAAATTEPYRDNATRARRVEEEFGDLLLAVTKLAYRLSLDAESALRAAIAKFRQRYAAMQHLLEAQGRTMAALSVPEKEALWVQAKRAIDEA